MVPHDPDLPAASNWIVGASAERTLIARRQDDGTLVCEKRYEIGPAAAAQQEFHFGRLARGPGVIDHLEVRQDAETGRPSVVLEFVDGVDLDTLVQRRGALDVRTSAALGRATAEILARLAALRGEELPAGLAHGDVKPSNLMLLAGDALDLPRVVLVDFEHAAPIGRASTPGFSGGTHGYAAPECYEGAPASEASDVFALGAVLCFLCSGTPPFRARTPKAAEREVRRGLRARWRFSGCEPRLLACIEQCLSPAPESRPRFTELAAALRGIASEQDPARLARDAARLRALAGDATLLHASFGHDLRARARLRRRASVGGRVRLPEIDGEQPLRQTLDVLPRTFHRLETLARIAPCLESARAVRGLALRAMRRVLSDLPPEVQRLRRAAQPDQALALCESALAAARSCGRLPLEPRARAVGVAARAPERFLERLRRDVDTATVAHARILERNRQGEADADLDAIDGAIAELTAMYGGASPVVAEAKDRRHRFEFYLARLRRLAAARASIESLADELGLELDLTQLDHLAADPTSDDQTHPPRALLRGLEDVVKEFPALAPRMEPARRAVHAALTRISEEAWSTISDAEAKLATPPIPIRPLTELLDRLDHLRQADAFVDVSAGTRADLYDAIESIRLKLDTARAERDRLTRGAREALDRGHLTTAIFDMERAVDRFGGGVDDSEAGGLADEYEAAKLRKREVEVSLEQSHTLAARYGELLAQPGSTPQERLAVLREREHALTFLWTSLGTERGEPYAQDLRDVRLEILRETAADGERRLASSRHDNERRAVAQRTLDALLHALPESATEAESIEARALIQVWSDRSQAAADAVRAARHASLRRGPLALRVAIGAIALAALVAVGLQFRGNPAPLDLVLRTALGEPTRLIARPDGSAVFDTARSVTTLREFGRVLAAQQMTSLAAEADKVAGAVDEVAAGRMHYAEARGAAIGFLTELADADTPGLAAPSREFAQRALRAAFAIAVLRREESGLAAVLRDDETLRRALSFEDANILDRLLGR